MSDYFFNLYRREMYQRKKNETLYTNEILHAPEMYKAKCPYCDHSFQPRKNSVKCPMCKRKLTVEIIEKIQKNLPGENFCYRCGHTWIRRRRGVSIRCPRCNSPKWNTRRKWFVSDTYPFGRYQYYTMIIDGIEKSFRGHYIPLK